MPNSYHAFRHIHIFALTLLTVSAVVSAIAVAAPVVYTAFVVTDVSLGGRFYHNAEVTFTFSADTRDIKSFSVTAPDGVAGSGLLVDKGRASVRIQTPDRSVHATFTPGQILVSLDLANGGVGFSSYIGPNGLEPAYPLGLDSGTVSSVSDLTSPTNITGSGWSCIGFPPQFGGNNGDCFDPTPYPLATDQGDFFIYNSYESYFADGGVGPNGGTMNRAIFSVTRPRSK